MAAAVSYATRGKFCPNQPLGMVTRGLFCDGADLIQVITGLPKDIIRFTQYIIRTIGFSLER